MRGRRRSCAFLPFAILLLLSAGGAPAPSLADDGLTQVRAKQVWQLLDYVALDYQRAVAQGSVIDSSEYAEMQEFAATAEQTLGELPRRGSGEDLRRRSTSLRKAIADKADLTVVRRLAHALADDVQRTYQFAVAPAAVPNLPRGERLFRDHCFACHAGSVARPIASKREAEPDVLADRARARERTLFALYQSVSNGVATGGMPGYAALAEQDRWALAFFAGTLAYAAPEREEGERVWQSSRPARQLLTGLDSLTQVSERALADRLGDQAAGAVTAYLRANPQALAANKLAGIYVASTRLSDSVAALRRRDLEASRTLALSAYLDGFELVESTLARRDYDLYKRIEAEMAIGRVRGARGDIDGALASQQALRPMLDDAERILSLPVNEARSTFVGALTGLLREGIEAVLLVTTMITFGRRRGLRGANATVHAGWVVALLAAVATWAAAPGLAIPGLHREILEGSSSLLAAVVLLAASVTVHPNGLAARSGASGSWRRLESTGDGLVWFVVAFTLVGVYCEAFEAVLACDSLFADGEPLPVILGLGSGSALLILVGFAVLRTVATRWGGQVLTFGALSLAAIAAVQVGKGATELQEAGVIPLGPIALPHVDLLGINPSWQTVLVQLLVVLVFVAICRRGAPWDSTR